MKPNLPRRKPTRLKSYDYSQPGAYFVTICVQHRKCLFETITDGRMRLNEIGQIVVECWSHISQHFPSVELGDYVIMPNHLHGIVAQNTVGAGSLRPSEETKSISPTTEAGSNLLPETEQSSPPTAGARSPRPTGDWPMLGKIVAYFKYQSTKRINQHRNMTGTRIWQRNY